MICAAGRAGLEIRDCVLNSTWVSVSESPAQPEVQAMMMTFARAMSRSNVHISPWAKVVLIANSTFKNVGHCLEFLSYLNGNIGSAQLGLISITNNIFSTDCAHPVMERTSPDQDPVVIGSDPCVLTGNHSNQFSPTGTALSVDANTVHHVVKQTP